MISAWHFHHPLQPTVQSCSSHKAPAVPQAPVFQSPETDSGRVQKLILCENYVGSLPEFQFCSLWRRAEIFTRDSNVLFCDSPMAEPEDAHDLLSECFQQSTLAFKAANPTHSAVPNREVTNIPPRDDKP